MIQLLALDLDGTLLDSMSRLPDVHARAVRRAQAAGVRIALCSGRNIADAAAFSARLEAPADWLITCNGADVRRSREAAPVYTGYMGRALFERVYGACAAQGGEPTLYTPQYVYYGRAFERFVESVRAGGLRLDFEDRDDYKPVYTRAAWDEVVRREQERICKAILYHDDPAVVDRIADDLQADGLFEIAPSTMFGGRLKNIEVNRAGVNKGTALAALAAHLGIPRQAVMAVGDGENDLPMFAAAGVSVAMANAPENVRQAARYTTAGHDENGVGRAIGRFIFGDAQEDGT